MAGPDGRPESQARMAGPNHRSGWQARITRLDGGSGWRVGEAELFCREGQRLRGDRQAFPGRWCMAWLLPWDPDGIQNREDRQDRERQGSAAGSRLRLSCLSLGVELKRCLSFPRSAATASCRQDPTRRFSKGLVKWPFLQFLVKSRKTANPRNGLNRNGCRNDERQ